MSASLPGNRELPASQYDLSTYWGRVRHAANISDPRTLLASSAGLENAKSLVSSYKQGKIQAMTPELWEAKKIVDSTLHPGMSSHEVDGLRVRTNNHLYRYWPPCCPTFPHVLLRAIQPRRHGRNAHSKSQYYRHSLMANNQSIAQRRHQQCQRQQILTLILGQNCPIIHTCCVSKLRRGPWSQCAGTEIETCISKHQDDPWSPCSLRSCG